MCCRPLGTRCGLGSGWERCRQKRLFKQRNKAPMLKSSDHNDHISPSFNSTTPDSCSSGMLVTMYISHYPPKAFPSFVLESTVHHQEPLAVCTFFVGLHAVAIVWLMFANWGLSWAHGWREGTQDIQKYTLKEQPQLHWILWIVDGTL